MTKAILTSRNDPRCGGGCTLQPLLPILRRLLLRAVGLFWVYGRVPYHDEDDWHHGDGN